MVGAIILDGGGVVFGVRYGPAGIHFPMYRGIYCYCDFCCVGTVPDYIVGILFDWTTGENASELSVGSVVAKDRGGHSI